MLINIKSATKQTLIYSIGNFASKIVGFVLLPLYTDKLSVKEFGVLGLIEVTAYIFVQIFQFRLYDAFQRWYYEKNYINKQKSLFFTSFFFLITLNILIFILLYFNAEKITRLLFNSNQFLYLIKLSLLTIFLQIINSLPQALMRIQEKSIFYISTNLIKLLSTLVVTIVLIVTYNRGLNGIFEAQLIGFSLYTLLIFKYILKNIKLKFEYKALKEMLNYSWPLVLGSISTVLFTTVDRYSLNYVLKDKVLQTIGIYTLAYKIANIIKLVVVDSIKLALPAIIFKQLNKYNNKLFYSKILTYSTLFTLLTIIIVSIFGVEIIQLFTKNIDYWKAAYIIPFISFSFVFLNIRNIGSIGLIITKKTKIIATNVFIASIINLLLNFLFIPSFKAFGAAFSTLISQIIFLFLVLYKSQKNYFIPYEIKKLFIAILVGMGLVLFSFSITSINIFYRIPIKICIIIFFLVLCYYLKIYSKTEIHYLKKLLPISKKN